MPLYIDMIKAEMRYPVVKCWNCKAINET